METQCMDIPDDSDLINRAISAHREWCAAAGKRDTSAQYDVRGVLRLADQPPLVVLAASDNEGCGTATLWQVFPDRTVQVAA